MARMDKYDAVESYIASALKAVESALVALDTAEPLGKTARVLNPRRRLVDELADARGKLQGCLDEYGILLEAALVEQERSAG